MKIEKIWFENSYIFIKTNIGHVVGNPLSWFPILDNATEDKRGKFEIYDEGIYWPELDEDLSLEGFFTYKTNFKEDPNRLISEELS